ncbi:DUF3617 domain-containing protein [Sphingobium subterraneum]|uniref:DUF3617 family protein n=1 Tax=Sphingobium subterraneum TaxID=627688 RepID=A0A841J6C3_9SPHN|nr:hypothetical protein [Sphingobium subterraneum]MBB6123761.1 hypothetical protein [Sphingobium subterraneum]
MKWRILLLGGVMLGCVAAMAPGGSAPKAAGMLALHGLEKGQWELRERGRTPPERQPRKVCVGDPAQLMQVGHPRASCSRFVVADEASRAAVTYQCNGAGSGRTDLRVETSRLVQIDAQGVANGAPFSLALEGRRVGNCP